jgi:two-component system cell cycle sensor histidine kinase/response regulator CckA
MVGGLVLLVAAGLGWSAYFQVHRSAEVVAADRVAALSSQLAAQTGLEQAEVRKRLRQLANDPALVAYFRDPSDAGRAIAVAAAESVPSSDSSLAAVELWDVAGRRLAASDTGFSRFVSPAAMAEVRAIIVRGDSAAHGRYSVRHDSIVYPVVAMTSRATERLGYVVQWRLVRESARTRTRIESVFGEGATLYIGSAPDAWTDQAEVVSGPPVDMAALGKPIRYTRDDGRGDRLAVAAQVPGAPWLVAMEFSEHTLLAPARHFVEEITFVALGILALALVAAWLLSRSITGPLRSLTAAAEARAMGADAVRAPVRGADELSRLATAFNAMADHVDVEVEGRRASEAQWRLVFKCNPHPMWVYDKETLRFLAVNDAAVEKYGYSQEDFLAMTLYDIRSADESERLRQDLAGPLHDGGAASVWRHLKQDGTPIEVQIDANSLTFDGRPARLVLAQDVTEHRMLEVRLRQSQRLEAVGRLAGGVAHDFNNLLVVIMTYTQLLHDKAVPGDPAREELAAVLGAAERAQALTKQLLALSRQQVLQPVVVDPNETLRNVEALLRRVIGEDIEVRTSFTPDVGTVLVDPSQLEQVLLNLAVNARDAMASGGRLTVATSAVDLDDAGCALHGVSRSGTYVVISVADTGTGMSADVRARIFDPFFTTKEVGKGTGLGLAIVYGIVTQSGGAVTVYSEPGMGTTFRVYLPRADAPAATPTATPTAAVSGHEVILVVEDDPAVRLATTHALRHFGYTVLSAVNGPDALELVARHVGPLDLVISDVVMPAMDGPTLIQRLREPRPSLKALLVSGYSSDAVATRGFANVSALFLEKPFSLASLSEKVREALDGRTTTFS